MNPNRKLIIQGAAQCGKTATMLALTRHELSLGRAGQRAAILTGSIAGELIHEAHAVTVAEMVQRISVQDMARHAAHYTASRVYRGIPLPKP